MHQTAFVTGATGLLGYSLVRTLLARNYRVVALSRCAAKAQRQFPGLPVEHVVGDMQDVDGFAAHLKNVDVVFHAAACFRDSYKGGSHRDELMRTNVDATRALLDATIAQGVRRWVQISSIAVLDGPPGQVINETMRRDVHDADDYYLSKILCDQVVESFLAQVPSLWATFILPGWMHGPGDAGPTSAGQLVRDHLRRQVPVVPPGTVSLVDARDVALAAVMANERGQRGERYLAAGRHMTLRDLLSDLAQVTGIPAPRLAMPHSLMRIMAAVGEWRARRWGHPLLISTATVKLMAREHDRTRFDPRKSELALGLRFRPLHDTLRDEVAWLRQHTMGAPS